MNKTKKSIEKNYTFESIQRDFDRENRKDLIDTFKGFGAILCGIALLYMASEYKLVKKTEPVSTCCSNCHVIDSKYVSRSNYSYQHFHSLRDDYLNNLENKVGE